MIDKGWIRNESNWGEHDVERVNSQAILATLFIVSGIALIAL